MPPSSLSLRSATPVPGRPAPAFRADPGPDRSAGPRATLRAGRWTACLAAASLASLALPASAQQNPWAPGFSGYLSIGPGVVATDSQFSTNDDNKRTSSLNDSGESTTSIVPAILGELRWTFASGNTQAYFGIPPGSVVEGDFLPELGLRQRYADRTLLTIAALTGIPGLGETWADPFVTGQDREETDVTTFGARIAGDRLFGTGLGLEYRYLTRSIDDERSGTFLGLTASERSRLERDIDLHRVQAEYAIDLGPGLVLTPRLEATFGEADGEANSFTAIRPQVSIRWIEGRWAFTANAGVGFVEFDGANPVFDRTREDDELNAQVTIGYAQPFDLRSTRVDLLVAASRRDSNIGFYDSDTLFAGVLFGYAF